MSTLVTNYFRGKMKYNDLIKFWGNAAAAAANTDFTRQALHKWKHAGYIPKPSQYQISIYSCGKLKVSKPYCKGDL